MSSRAVIGRVAAWVVFVAAATLLTRFASKGVASAHLGLVLTMYVLAICVITAIALGKGWWRITVASFALAGAVYGTALWLAPDRPMSIGDFQVAGHVYWLLVVLFVAVLAAGAMAYRGRVVAVYRAAHKTPPRRLP